MGFLTPPAFEFFNVLNDLEIIDYVVGLDVLVLFSINIPIFSVFSFILVVLFINIDDYVDL